MLVHLFGKWHAIRRTCFNKNDVYYFKVSCVSYLNLKQNKALKEQIDQCLSHQFDEKTSASMREALQHNSDNAIDLIMFYENRKSIILKVLGVVVYC